MIPLEVPEGDYCDNCVFLDEGKHRDERLCLLFDKPLLVDIRFGHVERVHKQDGCPRVKR